MDSYYPECRAGACSCRKNSGRRDVNEAQSEACMMFMRRINDVLILAKMKCRQVCMKDNHKPYGVVMALPNGIEPSVMKFREFQIMERSENS